MVDLINYRLQSLYNHGHDKLIGAGAYHIKSTKNSLELLWAGFKLRNCPQNSDAECH